MPKTSNAALVGKAVVITGKAAGKTLLLTAKTIVAANRLATTISKADKKHKVTATIGKGVKKAAKAPSAVYGAAAGGARAMTRRSSHARAGLTTKPPAVKAAKKPSSSFVSSKKEKEVDPLKPPTPWAKKAAGSWQVAGENNGGFPAAALGTTKTSNDPFADFCNNEMFAAPNGKAGATKKLEQIENTASRYNQRMERARGANKKEQWRNQASVPRTSTEQPPTSFDNPFFD